ncbi:hypothetical protein [Planotetraspora sp. GP83]|uniref:hypothetical protein n=1 Tax=Planotetraspora sp. GP83 TaxID=3156264 RepID=UPI0035151D50
MTLQEVRVRHRSGQWCSGVRTGDNIVAYDVEILPPWRVPGRPTTDRCFVIADEGIQITRPVTFVDALEGGWYIDLVELEEAGPKRLVVHDLYAAIMSAARAGLVANAIGSGTPADRQRGWSASQECSGR